MQFGLCCTEIDQEVLKSTALCMHPGVTGLETLCKTFVYVIHLHSCDMSVGLSGRSEFIPVMRSSTSSSAS